MDYILQLSWFFFSNKENICNHVIYEISIYVHFSEFSEKQWETVDMRGSDGEFTGKNLLERKDSDSDLFLPGTLKNKREVQLRWCCLNCKSTMFWKQYWWIPAIVFLAIIIYIAITVIIVTHMWWLFYRALIEEGLVSNINISKYLMSNTKMSRMPM